MVRFHHFVPFFLPVFVELPASHRIGQESPSNTEREKLKATRDMTYEVSPFGFLVLLGGGTQSIVDPGSEGYSSGSTVSNSQRLG